MLCSLFLLVAVMQTAGYAQSSGQAGNLVRNGSFEEKAWCPGDYTQAKLKTISGWNQANAGTPDHFDACSSGGKAGVPKNMFGNQPALDGNAYAGIVLFSQSKPYYREYLNPRFVDPCKKENGCAWSGGFVPLITARSLRMGWGFISLRRHQVLSEKEC